MYVKRLAARYFLLSFAIGFLVLSVAAMMAVLFVPPKMSDSVIKNTGGTQPVTYFPSDSDAFNILLMLGDEEKGRALFALLRFDPVRGQVPVAVLPAGTLAGEQGRLSTLSGLYRYAGIQNVADEIERGMGVGVDRYIKLGDAGIVRMVDLLGGVLYRLDEPVKLKSSPAQAALGPGEFRLSGNLFLELMNYNGYRDGEMGRAAAVSGMIASAINEYGGLVLGEEMDATFKKFVNIAETDLSIVDYQGWLAAGRFMARLESEPAYSVPVQARRRDPAGAYALSAESGRRLAGLFPPPSGQEGGAA